MVAAHVTCLGMRLRELRKNAGYTQEDLEKISGVPQNTISSIELGLRPEIKTGTLIRLAQALESTSDYLIGLSDKPRHDDK